MIKIAIVEDEAMYAKQLEEFLHQYEAENHEAFDITIYSDGDQIVNTNLSSTLSLWMSR